MERIDNVSNDGTMNSYTVQTVTTTYADMHIAIKTVKVDTVQVTFYGPTESVLRQVDSIIGQEFLRMSIRNAITKDW